MDELNKRGCGHHFNLLMPGINIAQSSDDGMYDD